MAKLILRFEAKTLKEVPMQKGALSIGRAPGNDIIIDNLAVSGHHAKVVVDEGRFVVEDLNSLNGTFLNNQRIRKSPLKEGDEIIIGKHTILFSEEGGYSPILLMAQPGQDDKDTIHADQTVVLDTKKRREFLAKATSIVEEGSGPETRTKIACLVVQGGKTDLPEYILTSKICVIGKEEGVTVRLRGWFLPRVAAVITRRGNNFDIAPSERGRVTRVNSQPLLAPQDLKEGDLIEIKKVKLRFHYRE